eukprot:CAMPEP_0179150416 /NCGR_PEP_ID=MMETSP0796-20121207/72950_1 /TAXON_ID=73915 /ORGANISM="Pyrodinium bahamense, Strain pbaha01" /LENGTH=351 /DNA_ID=CAMNT_0020851389 /DNA_START=138 /DNA_END=1193 /DNA_ORIENTATION=-
MRQEARPAMDDLKPSRQEEHRGLPGQRIQAQEHLQKLDQARRETLGNGTAAGTAERDTVLLQENREAMLDEVREPAARSRLGAFPGRVAHREAVRGDPARKKVRTEGVPGLGAPHLRRHARELPGGAGFQAPAAHGGLSEVDEDDLALRLRSAQCVLQRDIAVRHAPRVQPLHRAQQRADHGPSLLLALRPRKAEAAGEVEEIPARDVLGHQENVPALVEKGAVACTGTVPLAELRDCQLRAHCLQPACAVLPFVDGVPVEALRGNDLIADVVGVQLDPAAGPLRQRPLEGKAVRIPRLDGYDLCYPLAILRGQLEAARCRLQVEVVDLRHLGRHRAARDGSSSQASAAAS